MSYVGPITQDLLNACVTELRKDENKAKITTNIIDPLVHEVSIRLFPYIFIFLFVQLVIIGLLVYVTMK